MLERTATKDYRRKGCRPKRNTSTKPKPERMYTPLKPKQRIRDAKEIPKREGVICVTIDARERTLVMDIPLADVLNDEHGVGTINYTTELANFYYQRLAKNPDVNKDRRTPYPNPFLFRSQRILTRTEVGGITRRHLSTPKNECSPCQKMQLRNAKSMALTCHRLRRKDCRRLSTDQLLPEKTMHIYYVLSKLYASSTADLPSFIVPVRFMEKTQLASEKQCKFTGQRFMSENEAKAFLFDYSDAQGIKPKSSSLKYKCDEKLQQLLETAEFTRTQAAVVIENNLKDPNDVDENEIKEYCKTRDEFIKLDTVHKYITENEAKKAVDPYFTFKCIASAELQKIVKQKSFSLCEAYDRIWEYIYEEQLSFPDDDDIVECNEQLKRIFHETECISGEELILTLFNHFHIHKTD